MRSAVRRYIAFGLNVGNLGRASGKRIPMREWVKRINHKLESSDSGTRVVAWYGHTGNLVIDAGSAPALIRSQLSKAAGGTDFVVLAAAEVARLVEKAESLRAPTQVPGTRWTRGLVFCLDGGTVGTATCHDGPLGRLIRVSPLALMACKRDILDDTRRLDRTRRQGGWGAVATLAGRQYGGRWTARSLRTVIGVVQKGQG
jgi:hypothetical protein